MRYYPSRCRTYVNLVIRKLGAQLTVCLLANLFSNAVGVRKSEQKHYHYSLFCHTIVEYREKLYQKMNEQSFKKKDRRGNAC